MDMDEIDKKILEILQHNDKVPYYQIGKKLNIGASTVYSRVKKMVEKGIIKSFSAIVEPETVGYNTIAWIGLSVNPRKTEKVAKKLASYDEVQVIASSSGDHDIVLQVIARNEKELWKFIKEKIKTIDGVEKDIHVSTFIELYKRTNVVKL